MTADATKRAWPSPAVQIGKHYTGRYQGFADTTNGVFWEAMGKPSGDMSKIQQALLHKGKK